MKMKLVKQNRFILLMLSCFIFQYSNASEPNEYTYNAYFTESGINIDGILSEDAWKRSESVQLKINNNGETVNDNSIMTWFRVCYDDQNLYIAYECNDADICSEFSKR